jgi:cation diffusion facilitator family transporter
MENRFLHIRRVLAAALAANLLLGAIKITLGILTGSLSLIADAFHSMLDSLSSLIGYLGARVAEKPPDREHPYGHRKFETLGAMAISVMLGIVAMKIGEGIFERIYSPPAITSSTAGLVLVLFAMFVHMGISRTELHYGNKLKSELLRADGEHAKSDVYSTLLALVALAGAGLGLNWLDIVAAIMIVILIIRAALKIVRTSIEGLTDTARISPETIQNFVNGIENVGQCHRVRTRGAGNDVFMDMHLRVNPEITLERLHSLEHEVGQIIRKEFPDVKDIMIHFEPRKTVSPDEPSLPEDKGL